MAIKNLREHKKSEVFWQKRFTRIARLCVYAGLCRFMHGTLGHLGGRLLDWPFWASDMLCTVPLSPPTERLRDRTVGTGDQGRGSPLPNPVHGRQGPTWRYSRVHGRIALGRLEGYGHLYGRARGARRAGGCVQRQSGSAILTARTPIEARERRICHIHWVFTGGEGHGRLSVGVGVDFLVW
jgi:hypothetical protein